ncbi:hypothetical protein ABGB16_21495 [Micromonospora sp. B11E3]|uniref:hypothetical protein n=1 Tax=Micromonospora sp. B11E3 TaxID=3153562 RepID=UPI00325E4882
MARTPRSRDLGWLVPVGLTVVACGCTGFIFWLVHHLIGIEHLSDEQIDAGRPCTATVLSVADTSNSVNENTVYEVKLRIRPTDGAAYEATVRDALNSVEAGRVGAGTTEFRCVIDKDDPSRVEVFWSD